MTNKLARIYLFHLIIKKKIHIYTNHDFVEKTNLNKIQTDINYQKKSMKMPQTLNTGRFCKRSRHLTFYFCQFSCMFIFSTTSAQRVGLSLFARSSLFFRFSLSTSIHISSVYSFACLMIRWFGVKLCVLHVFFELVLHVSVRTGSSRHAQINRFTFFQAERKN